MPDADDLLQQVTSIAAKQWKVPTDIEMARAVMVKAHGPVWQGANYGWTQLADGRDVYIAFIIVVEAEDQWVQGIHLNFALLDYDAATKEWVIHPMFTNEGEQGGHTWHL